MIETREKIIDGQTVTVAPLPARRALALKTRLIKLLAPSIGALVSKLDPKTITGKVDIPLEDFEGAIEKLSANLDPDEYVRMILDILVCSRVDNEEITEKSFDVMFAGNFSFMYKVVWFTLQTNFSDFFASGSIGAVLSAVKMKPVLPVSSNE